MQHRRPVVFALFVAVILSASARAQDRDPIPLNDWRIPFEQIRAKVMETEPLRIAERSLHPSVDAVPSAASHFITIVPCRIVDTRRATDPYGAPKLVGGTSRTFNVLAGPCTGIPTSAAAYSLNFTVLNGEGSSGFLTAYPTGSTRPTVSTLNYGVGNLVANAAIVPAGTSSSIDVYVNYNVDLIIDINGYFAEGVVISLTAGTGMTGGGTGSVTLGINTTASTAGQVLASTGSNVQWQNAPPGPSGPTGATGATGPTGTPGVSPSGSIILGIPNDTTLINAGYTEAGDSGQQMWRATTTTGAPSGRFQHTAVWTGTKMIVWGGSSGVYENSGAQYDPAANSWAPTSTTGAPSGRYWHTAVWTGTKMIVWGGYSPAFENTGAQYDPLAPAASAWAATTTFGAPSARYVHTAVWTGTKMIVWGGSSAITSYENTGAQYDPTVGTSGAWAATNTVGAPSGRSLHTAVWTGTKMIVWGGRSPAYENTGAQYDPTVVPSGAWATTNTAGAPSGRYNHTAVWTGTKMIVWGGVNTAFENTGAQYDPTVVPSGSWAPTSTTGAPSGRYWHTAVWTGTKMIVWGGFSGAFENTGAQYDPLAPAASAWAATTTFGAPSGRYNHTAVWTGTKMIVWGGSSAITSYENTGGRWNPLSYYIKN